MILLTDCNRGCGYTLAGIISETGIQQAEIHLGMLEKASLVKVVKVVKSEKEEILFKPNRIWGNLLQEWLRFRKEECKESARRAGFYP